MGRSCCFDEMVKWKQVPPFASDKLLTNWLNDSLQFNSADDVWCSSGTGKDERQEHKWQWRNELCFFMLYRLALWNPIPNLPKSFNKGKISFDYWISNFQKKVRCTLYSFPSLPSPSSIEGNGWKWGFDLLLNLWSIYDRQISSILLMAGQKVHFGNPQALISGSDRIYAVSQVIKGSTLKMAP